MIYPYYLPFASGAPRLQSKTPSLQAGIAPNSPLAPVISAFLPKDKTK
jgi:hypothetical protein